jgi:hypothetical protein
MTQPTRHPPSHTDNMNVDRFNPKCKNTSLSRHCCVFHSIFLQPSQLRKPNAAPVTFSSYFLCGSDNGRYEIFQNETYEVVSKSFRSESITKYTLTTINTRWEATQRVTAVKLTRLTHKIGIQMHLVAKSCTICSLAPGGKSGNFWIHPRSKPPQNSAAGMAQSVSQIRLRDARPGFNSRDGE